MRSVMIGLVTVAVLLAGCSDEENTTKATEESNTGPESLTLPKETTDEQKVKGLTNLKELYLQRTKITDAGAHDLQKALPGCRIIRYPPRRNPAPLPLR